jgi:hypothetical protein
LPVYCEASLERFRRGLDLSRYEVRSSEDFEFEAENLAVGNWTQWKILDGLHDEHSELIVVSTSKPGGQRLRRRTRAVHFDFVVVGIAETDLRDGSWETGFTVS